MKAFPHEEKVINPLTDNLMIIKHPGMDLIDYFAAKAMQGLLATIPYENSCISDYEIAEQSYKIAAAMMEARKK